MTVFPVTISIPGPITVQAQLPEEIIARFLGAVNVSGNPSPNVTVVTQRQDARPEAPVAVPKRWNNSEAAKHDLKLLYRDVKPVGKKMLVLIAKNWESGISFDDVKALLPEEGDVQRRMNTVLQVARRMGYRDSKQKGVAPWDTEYLRDKPLYTMQQDLAQTILALAS